MLTKYVSGFTSSDCYCFLILIEDILYTGRNVDQLETPVRRGPPNLQSNEDIIIYIRLGVSLLMVTMLCNVYSLSFLLVVSNLVLLLRLGWIEDTLSSQL